MNNPLKTHNRAGILPCIVVCFSLLNIYIHPASLCPAGIYISVMGLLAAALFFFNAALSNVIFVIWAFVQLVIINTAGASTGSIYNLTQGFGLAAYFPISFSGNKYSVGINFMAAFFLLLVALTRNSGVIGAWLTFTAYRRDNSLGIIFPLTGKVERSVSISGEPDWLLVKLLSPITYKNKNTYYVLVKRNNKQPLVINQTNQLVFFKPVPDVKLLKDEGNNMQDYDDDVWALCK